MATRKNKVSWVIVVFLDSKDYSVVPTKWLVQNDSNNLTNSTVRFCFWPLGRVSSTDIHDALDPEASWIQYSIKIVGGNKTYDDFKKAWHIRVEKESESEEVQLLPKRKRTILNVSASSSDDDSESYSITPASTNAFKSSSNEKAVQYQELISVNNSTSQKQSQPTETFQPLLSEQNMSYQSSSEFQPQYTQSTTVYQPPSQDIQTKCQKLGSISSRHFRRIVNAAKEKCVMSTTSLPLRPYLIPPVVNINAIVSTEILTPSINTEVFNCHDSNVLNSVNHLENPSLDFSETPNLTDNKNGISDKLRDWIIHFKISHNAANSLLTVLQSEGMKVPKDVRTLMHTPKTKEMVNISNGSYIHLGLRDMLLPLLEINDFNKHTSDNILRIGINIDGLPIAKSSKSQLWPILISILNFKELPNNVLPIGIFHGFKKPHSIEEFLDPFIVDTLEVLKNGLNVNGTLININISNIVCDAPAKSFLLNVKYFNAYFGCTSCIEEGDYVERRVALIGTDAPLRTNETFRNQSNEEYHKGDSPILKLPINIINVVCLDYMHCVCLGVTKRLIEFWVKGKKNIRLTDENREEINNNLKMLRQYVPSEFCRLPRPIDDIDYWKATELRSFVLYSGAILF